jgi:hypothetical protein
VRLRIVWLGVAGYTVLSAVVIGESILKVSPLHAPLVPTLVSVAGLGALVGAGLLAAYGALFRRAVDSRRHFPATVHESVT